MQLPVRVVTAMAVVFMAGIILVPLAQVIMRGVFGLPFIGAEELTRFLLICLIFCSYPLAVEAGENIVMGEFKAALPKPIRAVVNLTISISAIAVCAFLAYVTAANISKNLDNTTPTLGIPFTIFLGATLFGLAGAAIVHLVHLRKPPQADTNVSI